MNARERSKIDNGEINYERQPLHLTIFFLHCFKRVEKIETIDCEATHL